MSTDSLIPPEGNEDPAFTHEKLDEIRASGREPYQLNYDRTHEAAGISSEFEALGPAEHTDTQVRVAGRIMTLRAHGKLAFADLKDESGRIQLFAEAENLGERFAEFCDLDAGDWAGAWGTVMTTKRGELSVRLEGFELLSKCLRPLPEKWHGLKDVERRYRQRYLDLIANPRAVDVFNVRVKVVSAIRTWLQHRGFKEVETPILHPVAGGALAKPFSTFHEALNTTLFLRVAPELYLKRLVIGGIEKVFEINRSFRNEGVSVQHNPEFTMLELYQALADYHDMADLLQEMIRDVCTEVRGGVAIPFQGGTIEFGKPFRKVRMIDLVAEAGADPQTDLRADCDRLGVPFDPAWPWGKLLLEIYEKKVERSLMQPTFVMDYPIEVSPLARRHRSDPRFTEHLDLVIAGMEVGVAYSELTDPIDQRRRFEGQQAGRGAQDDESHAVDDDFLKALEYGMPPTGGLGFGIDRFMMILADEPSIREVILFPALRQEQSDGGPVPKAET